MDRLKSLMGALLVSMSISACSSAKPKHEIVQPPTPPPKPPAQAPISSVPPSPSEPPPPSPASEPTIALSFEGVDSKDHAVFDKPVEVLAWSWGLSSNADGGSKRSFESASQDLSITKYIGSESPYLIKLAAEQKTIKKLILKSKNEAETTLTMSNAKISSVSIGGSGSEDRLTENVTFSFTSVETQYLKDGKTISSPQIPSEVKGAKK